MHLHKCKDVYILKGTWISGSAPLLSGQKNNFHLNGLPDSRRPWALTKMRDFHKSMQLRYHKGYGWWVFNLKMRPRYKIKEDISTKQILTMTPYCAGQEYYSTHIWYLTSYFEKSTLPERGFLDTYDDVNIQLAAPFQNASTKQIHYTNLMERQNANLNNSHCSKKQISSETKPYEMDRGHLHLLIRLHVLSLSEWAGKQTVFWHLPKCNFHWISFHC